MARPSAARAEVAARIASISTLALVCAAAVYAHTLFLQHAGGLWRDEANSAAFANIPSLGRIWSSLQYDSVPLASTLLFRLWARLGFGFDEGLRALGWLVGSAIVAALWISSRLLRSPIPIGSALLFVLNVLVIRGGDAIRPSGLGMLSIILAFATLAASLERPSSARVAAAALCAVLAVQTLYANVPLVAGLCIAGLVVGGWSRSRVRMLASAGIGLAAALSLLPYTGAVRAAGDWGILVRSGALLGRLWTGLGSTSAWDAWAWVLLVATALAGAAVRIVRPAGGGRAVEPERERLLYAASALVCGSLAFVVFLLWARLPTSPWYYLPLMALAAASLDALLGTYARRAGARLAACCAIALATWLHVADARPKLLLRQTSLDLVSAQVSTSAAPGDLVVVIRWFYGVTFDRYYSGRVPWTTVPPLEDTSIHRYDLLKRAMQTPSVLDPLLEAIRHTLQTGGRVWVVGELASLTPPVGVTPEPPPRAPAPGLGWSSDAYTDRWSRYVAAFLARHAIRAQRIEVPVPAPGAGYEGAPLYSLEGWQ